MTIVRRLLAQRYLAAMIVTGALLLKLLVPAGYMIDAGHGRIAITICSGTAPRPASTMMPGMHHGAPADDKSKDHGKAEMPCAFAGLSAAALGAIDPVQLAALIAFVLTVGLTGIIVPAPTARPYLRPPLRAPPARR